MDRMVDMTVDCLKGESRYCVSEANAVKMIWQHSIRYGAIAQLGERIVRNDEVVGSIPTSSTIIPRLALARIATAARKHRAACY
jgi:hypothetical protein